MDELDYFVAQYDAQWFLEMAKRIESGQSLAAAARCFRQLADTPAAINKLNRHRPLVPGEILRLNRAVHYLVRLDLLGDVKQVKRARSEIAAVWSTPKRRPIKEATIKDDYGDFGTEARRIVESIITHKQSETRDRDSILRDFDADMTDRSCRMRKPPKTAKAKARTRREK